MKTLAARRNRGRSGGRRRRRAPRSSARAVCRTWSSKGRPSRKSASTTRSPSSRYRVVRPLSASDHRARRLAVPRDRAGVVAAALSVIAPWWPLRRRGLARVPVHRCSSSAIRRATCPQHPNAVLSPADGRIVRVGKARDPYLDRDALMISVFMNVFNVHSNRSPVDGGSRRRVVSRGQLRQRRARQGVARERAQCAAPASPRRRRRDLRADRRADRAADPLLRRSPATVLARGQRYGFIRFGSRVDVYLPPDASRGSRSATWSTRPRRSSRSCR